MKTQGYIHSFETLGALDGPGMRCVVFFQGCPMRCAYCHNPDTWKFQAGQLMDSASVVRRILKSAPYFSNDGGVTLSGGEPLGQAKFAAEILAGCKGEGIHTAVDTCGIYLDTDVKKALESTDLVLLDIKHSDPVKFFDLTGCEQKNTLDFLEYVTGQGIPFWIRQVIVGGYNDSEADINQLAELLKRFDLTNFKKVELLGYHTMAVKKWKQMDIEYRLGDATVPEPEKLRKLQTYLDASLRSLHKH